MQGRFQNWADLIHEIGSKQAMKDGRQLQRPLAVNSIRVKFLWDPH